MICKIRKWELSDTVDLAVTLSNKKYKKILETDCRILTPSRTVGIIFLQCFPQMKMKLLRRFPI